MHNDDQNELDPAGLERLLERTAQLPREIVPATDAWPSIQQRIEQSRVREISSGTRNGAPNGARNAAPSRERAWWQSHTIAWAAAATLLVMLTAVVYKNSQLDKQELLANDTQTTGKSAFTVAAASTPEVSASIARTFARYDAAANDLAHALADRRQRLDPATVAVLDSCLIKIDAAIAEARAALGSDPHNAVITEMLTVTYQQKLDLLKRATDLPLRKL